jgi:hypothetical protein
VASSQVMANTGINHSSTQESRAQRVRMEV